MALVFYAKSYVAKAGKKPGPRGPRRKVTKTYERLSAFSRQAGNAIRADLVSGIVTFKKRVSLDALAKAWESGDYGRLFAEIPWGDLPEDLAPAVEGITGAIRRAAGIQLEKLPPNVNENLRFDITNPKTRSFIAERTGSLITGIQADTQVIVQDAVARSFTEGLTPDQVAAQIRDSIGLFPRQERALANYRAGLELQGIDPDRVEIFADAYENRLLDYRATMVAKTETRLAVGNGQLAVWQEGINQGLIDRDTARKEWVVDGDPCDICDPMDGVQVGINDPWLITMLNGEQRNVWVPMESHPNCFPPGHTVLTSAGPRPIETIRKGELVLTHRGRWQPVIGTVARNWSGELTVLQTAYGEVKSTPEHSHLINGRWIAAQSARQGDHAVEIRAVEVVAEQVNDQPAAFGKSRQFVRVSERFFGRRVPVAAVDFDCKTRDGDGNVNIVLSDSFKRLHFDSGFSESRYEFLFKAGKFCCCLDPLRPARQLGHWARRTAQRLVGSLRNSLAGFFGGTAIPQFLLIGHGSRIEPPFFQTVVDGAPGYSEFFRESFNRSSIAEQPSHKIGVERDFTVRPVGTFSEKFKLHAASRTRVNRVRQEAFTGTVHNLVVAEDHSYVCNGIVTHNCECGLELVYTTEGGEGEEE